MREQEKEDAQFRKELIDVELENSSTNTNLQTEQTLNTKMQTEPTSNTKHQT